MSKRVATAAGLMLILTSALVQGAPPASADESVYLAPSAVKPSGTAPHAREHEITDVKTYSLILYDGDEVFTAITEFARRHAIGSAHFTAIGAVHDVKVGWLDLKRKQYKVLTIEGQVEVLSLIGDVGVVNGSPVVHSHLVCGLPSGETRGGHLMHAVASPTLEIFITTSATPLTKQPDPASGMTLFN